jgi:mRNA interferase HicA
LTISSRSARQPGVKRKDLLKRLGKMGDLVKVGEGGNHTIFRINGTKVSIPRHREINELTAQGILKDAEEACGD